MNTHTHTHTFLSPPHSLRYSSLPLVKTMTPVFKLSVCYNLTSYQVLHLTEITIRIYTLIYKHWASICSVFVYMEEAKVSFTYSKLIHNLCTPFYSLEFKTPNSLHYGTVRLFEDNNSIKLQTFQNRVSFTRAVSLFSFHKHS